MTETRAKRFFHITLAEYQKILKWQRTHWPFMLLLGKRNSFEHNHTTGECRGLAEWRLNRAYGLIERAFPKNTSAVLRALADFHDNPPVRSALGRTVYGIMGEARYKKVMKFGPPPGHLEKSK